jgi:F-type H+-transporting ATPase subunit gamma
MANLKETRGRIKSIKSTQKITKAMKMVATAKLKKIRDSLTTLKEYTSEIEHTIASTISCLTDKDMKAFQSNPLIVKKEKGHEVNLIILNTSNKGLCGGINNYNLKALKTNVENLEKREGHKIIIYTIGKKGFDYCLSHFPKYLHNKTPVILEEKNGFKLDEIKNEIMQIIIQNEVSSSSIIFSKFISTTTQKTEEVMLTPIKSSNFIKHENLEYNFDSQRKDVLIHLLQEYMLCKILLSVFENATSEQSARMIAMENATTNACKAIKNLTLIYNRIRQANITREISEIVAGAASLAN